MSDEVVKTDYRCKCGWLLPLNVIAFYEDEDVLSDGIPGSYVALTCPSCGGGHSFFVASVDGSVRS